ncbi:hypothetical protein [Ideonella livida]|uniref:Uncharacterized protein n=1 Tax=Ideonella livida TaxID=2707176 RepID=A0A7C9PIT4_9BURK|nr:hypothetical protein [Ideonella livida]NDY92769.1 hypothetical protein [Ideonella livida]
MAQSTLCFLGLLDPSRVETGEKILLNVVRAVQRRVDDCTPTFGERARQDATQQFRATLEKLYGGLSLLHDKHDPLKDVVDPEVFVSLQLERVDEGEHLRRTFHTLLDHACIVLKADALVLAFDDADTSAHKGTEVMECLRKYLNSPRLVVLVAGDMELYAQLARRKMVENVGKEVEGAKPERQTQHHRMLDHLEEQYLLKVFPVQRRFQLLPLKNVDQTEGPIQLQWPSRTDTTADASVQPQTSLSALLTFTLQHGLLVKDAAELMPYRDYVLSWPIRSILQVLARCTPLLVVENGQIKLRGPAADAKEVFALLQAFQRTFTEAVRYACLGSLYAHGVDVDAIAQDHFPALIKGVVDVVLEQGNLDTGAYLRPTSTSESLNACFFALSAEVARFCMGRPDRAIAYMLMGPGTVSAFQTTQHATSATPPEAAAHVRITPPSVDEFKRYMRVGESADPLEWAWLVAPIWGEPAPKLTAKFSGAALDLQTLQAFSRLLYLHKVVEEPTRSLVLTTNHAALAVLALLMTPGQFFAEASLPEHVTLHAKGVLVRAKVPHSTYLPHWIGWSGKSVDWPESSFPVAWKLLDQVAVSIMNWLAIDPESADRQTFLCSALWPGKVWATLHFQTEDWAVSSEEPEVFDVLLDRHRRAWRNRGSTSFDVAVQGPTKKFSSLSGLSWLDKFPLMRLPDSRVQTAGSSARDVGA